MKTNNQYEDNNLEYKNKKSPAYKKAASFSKGFLWGAAIGGILGILFAPDKGENTRKKIKKTAEEYGDKGKETLEKTKKKIEPLVETAKEKKEKIKNIIEENIMEVEKNDGVDLELPEEKINETENNSDKKEVTRKYFKGVKKR
jgi:gas vesicle protein